MFMMKSLGRSLDAWEPFISAQTMDFHYNKHYKGYCDKLNELVKATRYENMALELVVKESHNNLKQDQMIYNNAAQMWNHEFFWRSLSLNESEKKNYVAMIKNDFESVEDFKQQFKQTAVSQFASGWCWAVQKDNKVAIIKTANADGPLTMEGVEPMFCVDVWEHAYYLDYQNRRADFVTALLDYVL